MRKTVLFTIFVLPALILTGFSPRNAYATEKSTSDILSRALSPVTLTKKQTPTEFRLFTPLQETYFRKQPPSLSLQENKTAADQYIAEVGESEVSSLPRITPTITPLPSTPTTSLSTEPDTFKDNLSADTIYALVNAARKSAGLPEVVQDPRVCSVAASRGPELYNEIVVTHTMHAGFYARNLPYWASEIVIFMHSEQAAIKWWMGSSVHRPIVLGDYQYACGTCVGRSCNVIFTNFTPKETSTPTTEAPKTS